MKHVFGSKSRFRIFLKKVDNFLFSNLVLFFAKKNSLRPKPRSILCFPAFTNINDLLLTLNKFSWAYQGIDQLKVLYSVDGDAPIDLSSDQVIQNQYNYIKDTSVSFTQVSAAVLADYASEVGQIAIHKKSERFAVKILPHLAKCKIVDPFYYSTVEGNYWKFAQYEMLSTVERVYFAQNSKVNFLSLVNKAASSEKAYLFLTGPSLESYESFSYEKSALKIVCNSIVKDTAFLNYIGGPDVICFADAFFHFSSCLYSHTFRTRVLEVVEKYRCFVVVPGATVPLLLRNYPQLKPYLIGLNRSRDTNFPDINNLTVKPTNSVLTFLMLPLATSLAQNIYIVGADGRNKNENYFWKHSGRFQFEDLMESVFLTHPSFFRDRIYVDYYEEHCRTIEELIRQGETLGKHYYALTKSFVPALQTRQVSPKSSGHA